MTAWYNEIDPFRLDSTLPSEVSQADVAILLDERTQNMHAAPVRWSIDAEPLGIKLEFWAPEEAEQKFLFAAKWLDLKLDVPLFRGKSAT